MDNFDEYLRQGEPNQAEKAKVWKTGIHKMKKIFLPLLLFSQKSYRPSWLKNPSSINQHTT